jgi:hypothetical protein
MNKAFFFLFLLTITFLACDKDNSTYSLSDIQGEWLEIENGPSYGGNNHQFIIEGDEAKLTLLRWTDVVVVGAPCPGNRTDYVVGTVTMTADHFTFLGSYSDETFTELGANCQGEANYELNVPYVFEDGIFVLNPDEPLYYQIHLEKQE